MRVTFIGAGPGDPELLTVKAKKLIETCGCLVYAGSLVSDEVVALAPASAERHNSAEMSLERIVDVYKRAKETGMDVARLHTGDPSLYGAILEQMNELDALGIEYDVVPGVSSFQAAAAALKIELTVPEKSQAVIIARNGGRTPVPALQELEQLAKSGATLCVFLSVQAIDEVAEKLAPHYGSQAPTAAVYRASWPDQKIVTGTLTDIAGKVKQAGIGDMTIIIVGPALERAQTASKLYDPSFTHAFRTATR
jgi:precorrin-4/cobalt-precorrin-4 C11-methyltransferase